MPPVYSYICPHCYEEFDVEQSIKAPKGAKCPACGEHTDKRLIPSGTSFTLRGAGWAKDNYSKGG